MKLSGFVFPIALGGIVALYSVARFNGADASYRLWYYVPAAIAVGFLAMDRLHAKRSSRLGVLIDCLVAAICISRPLFGWPAASGHALFFVYALLTGASLITRAFAAVLGLITLYAKIWLWNWDATLWPGLMIGLVGGYAYRRIQSAHQTAGKIPD
jgi:hypothetical protein